MSAYFRAVMLSSLLGCACTLAHAQTSAPLQLPAENVGFLKSDLIGYQVASQKCIICHSADYIAYQPPGMNLSHWTAEVSKMRHAYGAPLTDADIRQVGAYLAVAYGSAKATDADVVTASVAQAPGLPTLVTGPGPSRLPGSAGPANAQGAAAAEPNAPAQPPGASGSATDAAGTGAQIDVKSLLAQHACLTCHSLTQKVVGPAYHDVAQRYKNDANAVEILTTSLTHGSVGKWGAIPMPSFPALSAAQKAALAKFVLQQ